MGPLLEPPDRLPLRHSKLKENGNRASCQARDSWGCIFSILAFPEGSGMVHLSNINSCGTELCTLSVGHRLFPLSATSLATISTCHPHARPSPWTPSPQFLYRRKQRLREGETHDRLPSTRTRLEKAPCPGQKHLSVLWVAGGVGQGWA